MTALRRTCLAAVVATAVALLAGVGVTPAQAAATPWTLVNPTVPTAPNGVVEAVSCAPDASVCVEVGSYHDATGRQRPLVAQRTGTTWRQTAVSVPPASLVIELDGVSCASATACVAVGRWSTSDVPLSSDTDRPVAYVWNGSTWTRTDLALPAGSSAGRLAAVSCGSTTSCVAVGTIDLRSGGRKSLAYGLDGTAWTNLAVPTVGGGSNPFESLQAVSCAAARSCTAVGDGQNPAGLILAWNGATWSKQAPAAAPAGAGTGELSGVSCPTTTTCTAVGYFYSFDTNTDIAQAQRLTAGRWTRDTPPDVPQLEDVSCPTTAVCVATTTRVVDDTALPAVARRAADGSWSVTDLPQPKPAADYGALTGVSCTSADACTAVGTGGGVPFVERYTGSWAIERTVAPLGVFSSRLNGVSCTSASACTAVGRYDTASQALGLIERYDGTTWTRQSVPPRDSEPFTDLADVSCPTTSTCVAVGSAGDDALGISVPRPLLLRSNGSTWTTVPTPSPGPSEGYLSGVSCASATSCVAVGFAYGSDEGALSYVLRGSTWTLRTVPVPAGLSGVELTGVSCVSATACHAVGSGYDASGQPVHVDVVWNGRTWSTGPTVGTVDAVSCVRGAVCTAVGTADPGAEAVVINRLSGGAWTPQGVPAPSGTAYLAGVSCVAATTCTAVGTSSTTLVARTVAGGGWQLETAVKPAGVGGLHDVSCVDADRCVAVGTFGSRGVIEVRAG